MAITQNDILELVKIRLKIPDASQDAIINTYIEEIQTRILDYCHVDTIPDALKSVWASMVIDVIRVEQPMMPGVEETNGIGEKVQIGDTTVSSEKGPGLNNLSKSVIDAVVVNYLIDLNRYRRLRW
jgi:hypothetical protein